LAGICSLVAIVLESAGAIAELSAFSQLPELSKKIIAIKSRDFETAKNVNSFINLGILKFIKDYSETAVRNYPWSVENPISISQEIINDVVADIQDELAKIPKSTVFKSSLNSHLVILVCEIVDLFTAVKETEILNYLASLDVTLSRDELRRKLFLLEKFNLLKREIYSDATFYMIGKFKYHKLRLSLKDSGQHDAIRTKMECLEFYKSNDKQRNRQRAIQQAAIGLQR
ncbi:MAG TPA: retron St85 family effector protein, partial [Nitrosopumilaceae archaeon]|nr:retron St85 family effector protein [Nitrosopumilaceae archaeon]